MLLFEARDLLQLPSGDNTTDTIINDVHFNRTTLNHWNYTLYSNGTLSNGTNCWLTFNEYKPSLLLNGTFLNATSCYSPIEPIRGRGILGIIFGAFFGVSIVFTLKNLRKHGRLYLADEKRWSAVGRRWQWYWMLFIATCGTVSTLNGVDVDRDYLQSTSIILQSFFYYLMLPGVLACVWESVRHWGSWQERQICDADPFSLPQDDIRSRTEFYLPLIFYLFDWLVFFMMIPRPWTSVEKQHSPSQTLTVARPSALDARFKAGGFFALAGWTIICYGLCHSIWHYKPKVSTLIEPIVKINNNPTKPFVGLCISAVTLSYTVSGTWIWPISPLNAQVSNGWLFGAGYAPALLIVTIYNIFGHIHENDDKALSMQRQHRERAIDQEMGIDRSIQKPSWWSKMSRNHHSNPTPEERLRHLTSEIGGGPATTRRVEEALEMRGLRKKLIKSEEREPRHEGKKTENSQAYFVRGSTMLESKTQFSGAKKKGSVAESSDGSESSARSLQAKQQVVRSMLGI